MVSAQDMFKKFVSLVGKKVEVGIRSKNKKLSGIVTNAMFDSFLLDAGGEKTVVAFSDIAFIRELRSAQ